MEAKQFAPGPQTAESIVIDSSGVQWKVLKNIGNALAQPREGSYYSKITAPAIDYVDLIKGLTDRVVALEDASGTKLHESDFKIVDELGIKKLRIIR